MSLDRDLQRRILEKLATAYPDRLEGADLVVDGASEREMTSNVWYLNEHGLVDASVSEFMNAPRRVNGAVITARGLDFLQDDGGVSAILQTVTVRLHADTIRDLIAARIEQAELPAEKKSALIELLRKAPEEALKTVTKRLVEAALSRLPDAVQLLSTTLAGGG